MALFERLTSRAFQPSDPAKIPVHAFQAAVSEFLMGKITRQNVIDGFVLDVGDATELDAIKTHYDGLLTVLEKAIYQTRLHNVFLLCESGGYGKTKAKTELGF